MATGTYTQTNNPTPTYGESSSSVGALQQSLNQKYAGMPGWKPLAVDNKYGPMTLAATKFQPNSLVVSSGPANSEFSKYSANLTNMLAQLNANAPKPQGADKPDPTLANTNDPYTQMLDRYSTTTNEATKALIGTIQAARSNRANEITGDFDSYKRGLQLLGIQHNDAQATPDLLMGHIKSAENDQQKKLQDLDVEVNKALMEAESARASNDLNTLKEKMNYIESLKKEKEDYLKTVADSLKNQSEIAGIEAHDIYDTLNTLGDDEKEIFLQEVAKKYNIPLNALVAALADEKVKRESDALEVENRKSIIAARKKTSNSKSTKISVSDASSEIDEHLAPITEGGILGDDGFMAPEKWLELRDTWIKNKLTKTTFDTLYKRYLNPLSYTKAGFSAPKKESTRGPLF